MRGSRYIKDHAATTAEASENRVQGAPALDAPFFLELVVAVDWAVVSVALRVAGFASAVS